MKRESRERERSRGVRGVVQQTVCLLSLCARWAGCESRWEGKEWDGRWVMGFASHKDSLHSDLIVIERERETRARERFPNFHMLALTWPGLPVPAKGVEKGCVSAKGRSDSRISLQQQQLQGGHCRRALQDSQPGRTAVVAE